MNYNCNHFVILCSRTYFILIMMITTVQCQQIIPPYVKQCYEGDPELVKCVKQAVHHLRPFVAKGIPEIELPAVEPYIIDELPMSLTGGPNGYKITLKEVNIFGASNFTMTKLILGENGKPFEAVIRIPSLKIVSRYTSSGVLIIVPASGNGTLNAFFDDFYVLVKGTIRTVERGGNQYLEVVALHLDLSMKSLKMNVKNIYRNNPILTQAINLFLSESSQEVFEIMKPQLRRELSALFLRTTNQLFRNVPLDLLYVPQSSPQSRTN